MRLALALVFALAALPVAAQTAPAASDPLAAMADMPRVDGGGWRGAHAPSTPEMRAARQAARRQCQADMERLCADAMPAPAVAPAAAADGAGGGGGRRGGMMQCIRQHRAEVSPGCAQALDALRSARAPADPTGSKAEAAPEPRG